MKIPETTLLFFLIIFEILLSFGLKGQGKYELYDLSKKAWEKGDFKKAESILFQMLGLGDSLTERNKMAIFNRLGIINKDLGRYNNAIDYYKKAEQITLTNLSDSTSILSYIYNNMAIIFRILGDYDKAIDYYHKAFAGLPKITDVDRKTNYQYSKIYLNIGISFLAKSEYRDAIAFFEKSIKIKSKYKLPGLQNVYLDMAKAYERLDFFFKAKDYYLKGVSELGKGEWGKDENTSQLYSSAMIYIRYGSLLLKMEKKDSALVMYNKGLEIYLNTYGERHPSTANAYRALGGYHFEDNNLEKALEYYQKSLVSNAVKFSGNTILSNPKLDDVFSQKQLFLSLKSKTKALLKYSLYIGDNTDKIKYLKGCIKTSELAFKLIHKMRNDYSYESSQLLLGEESKSLFANALLAAMELNRADSTIENQKKAFEYLEKSKSATLSAYLNDIEVKNYWNIADSLLEKEKDIAINRRFYETSIQKAKAERGGYDTVKMQNYQDQQFYYSRQYDSLITTLKSKYPDYYKLKYRQVVANINDIQEQLDENSALINYFVADTSLFIAAVTKDKLVYKIVKTDSLFNEKIIDYHIDIKSGFTKKDLKSSAALYRYLISPVEELIKNKNNLIIIPDGYLYYVPFETLCKSAVYPDDLSLVDYLIQKHTVAYHHSVTLWLNSREKAQKNQNRNNNFIGFAPVFDPKINNGYILSSDWITDTTNIETVTRSVSNDLKHFNSLPYSEKEIKSIVKLFKKHGQKADGYFHQKASEETFKQQAQNYNFIHIASHSFANDNYPALSGIAFSQPDTSFSSATQKEDGILYAGESYNLNLSKADLVVLSSCKSGLGKLIKGEGFLSLSRGFLYSGAPNIVFSLWNVKDGPTKDLMVAFYKQVLEGKDYAHALKLAKMQLIKNPETSWPKYWAAWVLVGE